MNWQISLWTPGNAPTDNGATFGCASHGLAAPGHWSGPDKPGVITMPALFPGEVIAGHYADVLGKLRRVTAKPRAAVALFVQGEGMESFLRGWQELYPDVPIAGGAAARGAGQARGEVLPAAEDIALLMITEGVWRAETLNVHEATEVAVEFKADGPRALARLRGASGGDWESAAAFFRARQAEFGRKEPDCESITFSDAGGRNLHAAFAGEHLHTGADLPAEGRLTLRVVPRAGVAAGLARFCSGPSALVFGCAGLRGLLDTPVSVGPGSVAGFMFGELVTLEGRAQFGNLMAVRLMRTQP